MSRSNAAAAAWNTHAHCVLGGRKARCKKEEKETKDVEAEFNRVIGGGSGDGGDDGGCGAGVARPDLVRALTHVNRGQEPSSEASIAGGRGGFVLSSKDVHEGEAARWCACRCKGRAAAVVVGGWGRGQWMQRGGRWRGRGCCGGGGRTRCTRRKRMTNWIVCYGILEAKKLKRGRPSGIPEMMPSSIFFIQHPNGGPTMATQPTTATQIRGTVGVGDTSKMTVLQSRMLDHH